MDTRQYCSTSRANQALRSLANAGFLNRGVCPQAGFLPSPPPPPSFFFWFSFKFLARSKPKLPFHGLFLLRNQTETLGTEARPSVIQHCKKNLHSRTDKNRFVIQIQKALWRKLEPLLSRNMLYASKTEVTENALTS